jgi:TAT (twin-arginine translocation) pathway-exported protein
MSLPRRWVRADNKAFFHQGGNIVKYDLPSAADTVLNRRQLLRGSAVVAALAAMPAKLSAGDTYRFRHGGFDISVLSDGEIIVPGNFIALDGSPAQLREALADPDAKTPTIRLKTTFPSSAAARI